MGCSQVFSISRNKVHRLPAYFAQFKNLHLFRADQNSLEWPPKHIMDQPGGEDSQLMKDWIRTVQKWITTNSANGIDRKASEDSNQDLDEPLGYVVCTSRGPRQILTAS